jgi:hypothetical protein
MVLRGVDSLYGQVAVWRRYSGNCSEGIVASRLIIDGTNCYGTKVKSIFN